MGEVIDLPVMTTLDLNPDKILQEAIGHMNEVIIIGRDKKNELYLASSIGDINNVLWRIEKAKQALLNLED